MYIHASVKTQVLIHPVHCIIGRALLMLHRHNLYLNWHVSFLFEIVLITVNLYEKKPSLNKLL